MDEATLKAFCNLLMASDPWPLTETESDALLQTWADRESQRFGYTGWIEAFHRL